MNFLRYMQGILALAVHVIACRGQHYAFQHTPCEEEEEEATLTLDSFFFFFFTIKIFDTLFDICLTAIRSCLINRMVT